MTTETLSEIHLSYKPGLTSSTTTITNSQNAYEIGSGSKVVEIG